MVMSMCPSNDGSKLISVDRNVCRCDVAQAVLWCAHDELIHQGGVVVHELPGFRLVVRWSPKALRNMLTQQVCACLPLW